MYTLYEDTGLRSSFHQAPEKLHVPVHHLVETLRYVVVFSGVFVKGIVDPGIIELFAEWNAPFKWYRLIIGAVMNQDGNVDGFKIVVRRQ